MPVVISADGTRIGYETHGSGPVLIVVMGATQYRAVDRGAAALAALLDDTHTVILYDRRGRGESGNTPPYAVAREIDDIAALIDAEGGPARLYGMSSGGMLAIEAAAAMPDRIERVVAYEPPVQVSRPASEIWAEVETMERLAATGDGDACMRMFMGSVGMPEEQLAAFASSPGWPKFAAVGTTIAHDFRILAEAWPGGPVPRLRATAVPVLVVDGDASYPFMASGTNALAAALPMASRRTLAGQGHGPAPEAIAPVITDFLKD